MRGHCLACYARCMHFISIAWRIGCSTLCSGVLARCTSLVVAVVSPKRGSHLYLASSCLVPWRGRDVLATPWIVSRCLVV